MVSDDGESLGRSNDPSALDALSLSDPGWSLQGYDRRCCLSAVMFEVTFYFMRVTQVNASLEHSNAVSIKRVLLNSSCTLTACAA